MKQDRLTVLREMRPQTSLDAVWTPDEQKVVRERILVNRTGHATAGASRRKRAALAGVVVLGLVAVPGAASAVGSGMKPQAFVDVYSFWGDDTAEAGLGSNVDPATAKRAATAPGPYGGTFSVLTAKNGEGLTCIAPIFETADSAQAGLPNNFDSAATFCHEQPSTKPFQFDSAYATRSDAFWWAHAGDAVRGETRMTNGDVYPAVLVEGYLFGWHAGPLSGPSNSPLVIGFDADDREVGRFPLGGEPAR